MSRLECIAGYLERPLYRISWRDWDNEAVIVEGKIRDTLFSAKHWGAVLLLKEADVLFGKGATDDLATKNSAISRGECQLLSGC